MAAESSIMVPARTARRELRPIASDGWTGGLGNLVRHELRPWFRTRFGLIQAAVWLLAVNGFMAIPLWIAPRFDPGETGSVEADGGPYALGVMLFFRLGIQICSIGAAVLAMGALVGEKQSGTAAWVLSKPVSRVAFVLAKVIALTLGSLAIMVGLNAAVAYVHIGAASGTFPEASAFLAGTALLALAVVFALALTVMLGAFFDSRGAVIGVAIGVLVGEQMVAGFLGPIASYLPSQLGSLAAGLALGQPLPSYAAVVTTAILSVVCVATALWRFSREEL